MYDGCVYHCFTDGRIWANLGKAGIQKSRTTLGEIAQLHNCAVTICSKLPDMRPLDYITPQLRLSAKKKEMDGWMVKLM